MKRPPAIKTGAHWKAPFDDAVAAMKYVIIGLDGPEGEAKRKIYREAHLANLAPLDQAGRVVLAGPLTDKTGSLIVIEAASLEEAQRIAREDPYTIHGVFERVEVHPFTQVFPKSR
jgi:uncharacterized protein YciI